MPRTDQRALENSADRIYQSDELEFLDKTDHPEPLLFRVSEIVYQQCRKERQREAAKKGANAFALVSSCLILSLMIAWIVSVALDENLNYERILNMTKEITKNESLEI